jgi:Tol biopolymer transport system component
MNRVRTWLLTLAGLILPLAIDAGEAGIVKQLTDLKTGLAGPGALDDAGTFVLTGSSSNQLGSNPTHAYQIFRFDAATGAGTQLTSVARGVTATTSVSDDGQWFAFVSPADLLGTNHDLSPELYVQRTNGTGLAQLTSDPAVNGGSVSGVTLAGNGLRLLFTSNTNPLGTNPALRTELFVVERDGTGLRQLTTTSAGSVGSFSISDDGTRVVFTHNADLLGTNADLSRELYAINSDGTGLRQLTNNTLVDYSIATCMLSGSGNRIAFQSNADLSPPNNTVHQDEIFVIDWAGTGLRQLTRSTSLLGTPAAQFPSITDDGVTVVFHSNLIQGLTNFDGNFEIWRIRFDGTQLRALTNTAISLGCFLPTVSGNGGRISFYYLDEFPGGNNDDGNPELHAMDGNGLNIRQLSVTTWGFNTAPTIPGDASIVVFASDGDLLGTDPDRGGELYRVTPAATGLAQVTILTSGGAANPTIADDGSTIVFESSGDPTGGNGDASTELFRIRINGTGIQQLTNGGLGRSSQSPQVAANGSVIVYESDDNPTGQNPDNSVELFRINGDGTGVLQLTSAPTGRQSVNPRLDATGTWIAFESNADLVTGSNLDLNYEIFRIRSDGSGLQQITNSATSSRGPDLSGDGRWIVFSSSADLLGSNPELNSELFLFDTQTSILRQLTSFATGAAAGARITRDGASVWFSSNAAISESDPDTPTDLYRLNVSSGAIERAGALRAGSGSAPALSADGSRAVFSGLGDLTEQNPDLLNELFWIDRSADSSIRVSRALPTVVSWDIESGPLRYDVVRGNVQNLALSGVDVTLGPVVCLEDDSPDASTSGFGDAAVPAAGQSFFFLYRGSQGLNFGPGSWGTGSQGAERLAGSGSCSP